MSTDEIVLSTRTVVHDGVAHHTNLSFGGRFGHSAIYHPLHQRQAESDHETALCVDRQRDFYVNRGRSVRVDVS